MKTTRQHHPATLPLGRRFLKTMVALNAVLLLGGTAFAGPKQLWATTISSSAGNVAYPSPRVLTIDSSGNSYIVGTIDNHIPTHNDAFLAKLDANGSVVWTTSISSSGSATDQYTDAVIDAAGDLVVTGYLWESTGRYEWITAKYDTAGNLSSTWPDVGYGVGIRRITSTVAHCRGWRCLLESNGDVVVAGNNSNQLVMVRYTSTGGYSAHWPFAGANGQGIRTFTPPGNAVDTTNPAFVKKDPLGNYYLAGTGQWGSTGYDYIIAKFNSSGTLQWDSKYSPSSSGYTNGFDTVYDLAVDLDGHAYVTGESQNPTNGDYHMAVVRFNTGGGAIGWFDRTSGVARGRSIEVNASGAVFVAGISDSTHTMSVWKYNSSGNLATSSWPAVGGNPGGVRRLGGTTTDGAEDIWLTPAGELYVTGRVWDSTPTPKMTTWKLDASNGTTTWIEQFGANGNDSIGLGVKVGPGGHIIATGTTQVQFSSSPSILVLRYAP